MASSLASPRAASLRYLSANWTLFTFSCSWTSMFPYSRSLLRVIFGCSKVGGPSFEFTSFFPTFSTPTLEIHFLTSSSYTLALRAPKKSAQQHNVVDSFCTFLFHVWFTSNCGEMLFFHQNDGQWKFCICKVSSSGFFYFRLIDPKPSHIIFLISSLS